MLRVYPICPSVPAQEDLEVIVVDAGGSDGTMALVKSIAGDLAEINVRSDVVGGGGRGPTLSAGVAASSGSILLFLHADTMLPRGFDIDVRTALAREKSLATAFRFHVTRDPTCPIVGLGTMERTVHYRSSIVQLPFGDQALAITKQRFDALGGFPPGAPIMEDFELVQKLRRCGAAGAGWIVTLDAATECSGRRWATLGVWRANLLNQVIMVAYTFGGASTKDIYDWYYCSKGPASILKKALRTTLPGRAVARVLRAVGVLATDP